MKKLVCVMLVLGSVYAVQAQKKEIKKEIKTEVTDSETPGKVKVRIEKNINGKVEVIEKEVDKGDGQTSMMIIDENLDSLIEGEEGKQKVIIKKRRGGEKDVEVIIDDEEDFEWMEEGSGYPQARRKSFNFDNGMRQFNFEMERLHDRMADIPYKLRGAKLYEFDDRILKINEEATVKSVDVFTNRPETNILNIRFYAPKEGDVNITVLDLAGKVVAKEDAKKFKGEYVGQIKLNKGAKGTYFVLISQGEDGVTRKVRID
jgi:hypothetical protein